MTDQATAAPETAQTDIAQVMLPSDAPEAMSVTQAARMLSALSRKPKEEAPAAPEAAAADPTQSDAPQANNGDPQTEAPAEQMTEAQAEPEAELPPIEPPRSWKAEEKERFKSLPRDTQAYLVERETERDRAIRQSQNEAAEIEQARQQYEAALPQLLQTLQQQQQGEFADIKTIADVERLAKEDFPRYLQWDVAQKKIAAVQQEMLASQQRARQEKQQQFAEFSKRQDDLFAEKVPDMKDPAKAAKLQSAAMTVLKELGFEEAELASSWNGEKDLSFRDHRVQLLIRDATLWREAQQKAVTAAKKAVPPVQRPGAATVKNAGADAEIQNLQRQLDTNPSGRKAAMIAAKIVAARRAAAR